MVQRIAIVALLLVLMGFIGLMMSVPLLLHDPLPVVGPGAPARFMAEEEGSAEIARLTVDAMGRFDLRFRSGTANGTAPPQVTLSMLDHEMPSIEPMVETLPDGALRAAGTLPMPGRWRISLGRADEARRFDFILRE